MRKRTLPDPDLERRGNYFRRAYRWNSDREFFSDTCELLYDRSGHFVGVDYRKDVTPELEFPIQPLP